MNTAFPSAQEGFAARPDPRLGCPLPDAADQIETRIVREATLVTAQTRIGAPEVPADLREHARYEIVDFLGAGGMGSVFKARHRLMGRHVALKVIHPDWAGEPAMVERFAREIRAAARLCHPNIVAAHDAEQVRATHFLVMEFVDGETLEEYITRHARRPDTHAPTAHAPIDQVCDYIRQAALGLQHTHERGVVHHDIKPHNLMLTPWGQVKILDFGLARFTDEDTAAAAIRCLDVSPFVTSDAFIQEAAHAQTPCWRGRKVEEVAAGYPLGTVDYLAPEEVDDPRRADIRGDVYSLGCTLYRCLTGQVPFAGRTLVQKLKGHRKGTPTPMAELRPNVPPALAGIVARMMAKDPAQRYQTPAEVAAALTPFAAPGHLDATA